MTTGGAGRGFCGEQKMAPSLDLEGSEVHEPQETRVACWLKHASGYDPKIEVTEMPLVRARIALSRRG